MKNIIRKITSKFRKNPTPVILTNGEKIKELGVKAVGLFTNIKQVSDDLSEINLKLGDVINEENDKLAYEIESHKQKVAVMEANIGKSYDEIHMNMKVQDELKKFIR